jgi:hypothetical protein
MSKKLPLAVGIADAVSDAQRRNSSIDVDAKTDQLLKDHPEAETTRSIVEKTLREESADAGVRPKRPDRSGAPTISAVGGGNAGPANETAVKRLKKGGSAWGFDTAPANTRRRRRVSDTTAPGGAGACMTRTARRRFTLQGEITLAANLSWQRVAE